jgi:hypothetical protein
MKKLLVLVAALVSMSAFASKIECTQPDGKVGFRMDEYSFTQYYGENGWTSYATKYNNGSGIVETNNGFWIRGINFYYDLTAVATVNARNNTVTIVETSQNGKTTKVIKCADLKMN